MKLRLIPILLLVLLLSSFAFADFTTDNQLWASLQDGNVSSFDVYGGVTGAEGVVDGAFEFDGTGGYSFYTGSLTTEDISTSFWFNADTVTSDDTVLDFKGDYNMRLRVTTNALNFESYDGSDQQSISYSISPDTWYHVVATYDRGTGEKILYVDGVNRASETDDDVITESTSYHIGAESGGRYFDGTIDEVKFFNKILNSTEITELYNSGSPVENIVAEANKVFYASFDSLYDQSSNSNPLSAYNGVTYDATTDSYDFDGTDDYLKISDDTNNILGSKDTYFFNTWLKLDSADGDQLIGNYNGGGFIDGDINFRIDSTDKIVVQFGTGSGVGANFEFTSLGLGTNEHMITIGLNTSNVGNEAVLYVDGSIKTASVSSYSGSVGALLGNNANELRIGSRVDDTAFFDGTISGVSIYNRTLSSTEVAQLYAEGRDFNPYGTLITNTTISARDSTTLNNIQTFNATVNGTFYNTTSGLITLPYLLNESNILNITVNAENYISYTNESFNGSNNLVADLDPELLRDFSLTTPNNTKSNETIYNITYTEAVSPTSKTVTYNVSIYFQNGTLIESHETTDLYYELNTSTYNANIYNVTVNAEEDATGTNYTHSSLLYLDRTNYVYFYDGTNSSPLVNSSVIIDRPYGSDLSLTTDSEGKVSYQSFEGFTLLNGTHVITYSEDEGYVTPLINTYNATTLPFNISYNVTRINLTINIHDEVSGNLITGTNITVDIIDGSAYQYTTTTGTLNFDYFTPGVYEFRYYSTLVDDYKLRSDFINITATSDQDINLYLLNESDTGITTATITFNVFGSDLSAVEDAEVVVARYYSSSNSFVDVWSRKTNSQGAAVGQFETIDAFYQYRVIYNGQVGFISSNSGVQFNANDQIDIFIDTQTNLVSQFNTLDSIDYTDISFTQTSNTTGTFQFSFSGDTSATVCLEVTSYNFADNGFNSTCVTSTGGTLFLPVEAGNYETTFVAKATIEVSSDLGPQVVDSDTQTLNGLNEPTDSASWKENLAWIAVLVTITSALLFISFSPNAALLFQGISFLAMTASPIQIVPIPVSVGVVFICIVLLIINVSRGRG